MRAELSGASVVTDMLGRLLPLRVQLRAIVWITEDKAIRDI